jgi:hypothetical protein
MGTIQLVVVHGSAVDSRKRALQGGMPMYLRLSRTRIDRAREHEVVAALRTWLTTNERRPQGLLDLVFARRLADNERVEHVTASLWADRESMIDGLGPGWDRPTGLIPSVAGQLDDHRIEHFEVFADDWPDLVAYCARRTNGDTEGGTSGPARPS